MRRSLSSPFAIRNLASNRSSVSRSLFGLAIVLLVCMSTLACMAISQLVINVNFPSKWDFALFAGSLLSICGIGTWAMSAAWRSRKVVIGLLCHGALVIIPLGLTAGAVAATYSMTSGGMALPVIAMLTAALTLGSLAKLRGLD